MAPIPVPHQRRYGKGPRKVATGVPCSRKRPFNALKNREFYQAQISLIVLLSSPSAAEAAERRHHRRVLSGLVPDRAGAEGV